MTEPTHQQHPAITQVSSQRPRQPRATITKAKILQAAARAFAYDGYAATSLNALVVASSSTKGAIYFHFDSKEAIARELLAHWSSALHHAYSAVQASPQQSVAEINSFFRDLAASVAVSPLARAGLRLAAETGIDGAREAFTYWIDITNLLVDSAIESGELPDNSLTRQLAWNLCAGFVGTVTIIRVIGDQRDFTTRMQNLTDAHLSACASVEMS
ncbi:TetR/AcrR family transcriptional regulator [Rhodococcus sp. KBS0724]|uniref:TetR/AcrR family transcriptional regulator n=1 Tax=Rhodococcus sp. KBS0724 TaxID=1179674 RepID=UPI00110F3F37|nr:TetR/AcrR family transcriptional regulator [Rhodococcus sp. KBS0724]TSD40284.1 TetR/AcrR family transcriptional regulator [Rhodococcus sp. KBS0724]